MELDILSGDASNATKYITQMDSMLGSKTKNLAAVDAKVKTVKAYIASNGDLPPMTLDGLKTRVVRLQVYRDKLRKQLKNYTASQVKEEAAPQSGGIMGKVVLVGALAAGAWFAFKG